MKTTLRNQFRWCCLVAATASSVLSSVGQDTVVKPSRGGGLDTNAPMIHCDIFYDYTNNQMQATLDTTKGIPKLVPLPAGYTFDSRSNYAVLNGKAYNYQYAWNPGGIFTNPAGAALWIECLSASPKLECYDGPGNKMLTVPRPYTPIFGTAGSSTKWSWYGSMAHNSYAILNPTNSVVSAQYHVYFGDAQTGARDAYASYGDANITLTWMVDLPVTPVFQFGAESEAVGAASSFINSSQFLTNSLAVLNCRFTNAGPCAQHYECPIELIAVPATAANGGPATNHAALGARLELELISLTGPTGGALRFWEATQSNPSFSTLTGVDQETNRIVLSQTPGSSDADPYGAIQGRHLAVTQPGLYCLAFRVLDTSTNGPGGGPVHPPSPSYQVFLEAGLTIHTLSRQGATTTVLFGGEPVRSYYLERSPALGAAALWQTVAGPLTGTSRLQTLSDAAGSAQQGFFRLRVTTP
jgi:hypothetical protein